RYLVRAGVSQLLLLHQTNYDFMINRAFKSLSVSANCDFTSTGGVAIGTTLSYSFDRDPYENRWHASALPQAPMGAASVFVYEDKNRDGKFDAGDRVLPNVGIQSAQHELNVKTDDGGHAFITQLAPYQPLDMALSLSDLEDPYLKPVD